MKGSSKMASKGATTLELNISLKIELDEYARADLVEEIHKEWKKMLHDASMRILKLDKNDDGLRTVSTRITATPTLADLKKSRILDAKDTSVTPILALVRNSVDESSPHADLEVG